MDATTGDLMTIHDLAARWDVSTATAKKHVRRRQVPFIQIGGRAADLQINWSAVRFLRSAVAQWEEDSQRVFEEPDPAAKAKPAAGSGKYKYVKMR